MKNFFNLSSVLASALMMTVVSCSSSDDISDGNFTGEFLRRVIRQWRILCRERYLLKKQEILVSWLISTPVKQLQQKEFCFTRVLTTN